LLVTMETATVIIRTINRFNFAITEFLVSTDNVSQEKCDERRA